MTTSAKGPCALCLRDRRLRDSHIIPQLIPRWIKKDAPGTLFQNLASGVIRQDVGRKRLFCGECEQLFSPWENKFRNRVFDPYLRRRSNFARAEWLTRFATSMAFRVGTVTLPELQLAPNRRALVGTALEDWRQYLLAGRGATAPSVHELLFLDGRTLLPPRGISAEQISRYYWTAIDPTVIASSSILGVYTKLPGMLIWSPIHPQTRTGWRGTMINGVGTIRANKQMVKAPFLTHLVASRIREIRKRHGDL